MRGRILLAMLLTAVALAACSRKDSLYMDPGKRGPSDMKPAKSEPAKPPAKP